MFEDFICAQATTQIIAQTYAQTTTQTTQALNTRNTRSNGRTSVHNFIYIGDTTDEEVKDLMILK